MDKPIERPDDSLHDEREPVASGDQSREDRVAQLYYWLSHYREPLPNLTSTEPSARSSSESATGSPDDLATKSDLRNVEKRIKASNQKTDKRVTEATNQLSKTLDDLSKRIDESEDRLSNMDRRSVETIGIFSSFVALVLSFVNTATRAKTTSDAFLILAAEACGLVIFATLLEAFFGSRSRKGAFYILPLVLPILTLAAVAWYLLRP